MLMRLNILKFFTVITLPRKRKITYILDGKTYIVKASVFNEDYYIIDSGPHKGMLLHKYYIVKS